MIENVFLIRFELRILSREKLLKFELADEDENDDDFEKEEAKEKGSKTLKLDLD